MVAAGETGVYERLLFFGFDQLIDMMVAADLERTRLFVEGADPKKHTVSALRED